MSDKRFNASVNCRHRSTLTQVMARVPAGGGNLVLTAEEDKDIRDLAGALNYWATQPGGCDIELSVADEILFGDFERKFFYAKTEIIHVFPFRMQAHGIAHIATSENGGQPWDRLMTLSTVAGDMSSPIRSQGKLPDLYFSPASTGWPAGTMLYANNVLTQEPTVPNSSRSGFSVVWPAP